MMLMYHSFSGPWTRIIPLAKAIRTPVIDQNVVRVSRCDVRRYNNACTCALMERDHIDQRTAQLTMHGIRFT
jgi:hypothetical protein